MKEQLTGITIKRMIKHDENSQGHIKAKLFAYINCSFNKLLGEILVDGEMWTNYLIN